MPKIKNKEPSDVPDGPTDAQSETTRDFDVLPPAGVPPVKFPSEAEKGETVTIKVTESPPFQTEKNRKAEPLPDPSIVSRDPMAELFGPGTGIKLLGEEGDEMPDEVRCVLEENGLSKGILFQCVLREIPEGGAASQGDISPQTSEYIKSWTKSVPSTEWIKRNYGPGLYVLIFTWRTNETDDFGKRHAVAKRTEVTIPISKKAVGDYRKHRMAQKIETMREMGSDLQDSLIDSKMENEMLRGLTGGGAGSAENAKKYIAETMEAAKMIGLTPLSALPQGKSIEWDKLLPPLITAVTAFLKLQQDAALARESENTKLYMLMLGQNQSSSNQLLEFVKASNQNNSGSETFQEFAKMLMSTIDLKTALAGPQAETLADKIFRVIEGVAPQILSIAASAAEAKAKENTLPVRLAKTYMATDPDFKALKQNPVEYAKALGKMDDIFGTKQTDIILQVAGWERPEGYVKDPEKEEPRHRRTPQETGEEATENSQ